MGLIDRLDRATVLQEATYGFVMALTFVTANQLGFLNMSRSELVISILAMDFVWGVIDMVVFFDSDVIEQRRRRNLLRRLYSSENREQMRDEVYDSLGGSVFDDLDEDSKRKAVDLVMNARMGDGDSALEGRRVYLFNAVTAFAVNFGSAIPVALCILFIPDLRLSLVAASLVSVVALFFIGYHMAPGESKRSRVLFGTGLAVVTLMLTLFAAYFGG